jgi:hypothetical protein
MDNSPPGKVAMKALGFVWASIALAFLLSGCMTTQQETHASDTGPNADVKANAKTDTQASPKFRTVVRTRFIEI